MMKHLPGVIGIGLLLTACVKDDACQKISSSQYSCTELGGSPYNVMFTPKGNDAGYNIGATQGLAACGITAYNHATSQNLDGWSYYCCLKTGSSDCAEKHR